MPLFEETYFFSLFKNKDFPIKEQRMCLGTFLRLRRSLATPTLYAAVRILSGAFVVY